MTLHNFPLRIYYEDTDAGGIVYHANYLNFCERARTEMIHDHGYSNNDLIRDLNVLTVVRHIDVNYLAPAVLEDMLNVQSSVKNFGHTSFLMEQNIMRGDLTLATLMVKLVCIDAGTKRPVKIPETLRGILS